MGGHNNRFVELFASWGWENIAEIRAHFGLWVLIKCHLLINLDGPPEKQLGPHLPLITNSDLIKINRK